MELQLPCSAFETGKNAQWKEVIREGEGGKEEHGATQLTAVMILSGLLGMR